ncbi:MAG: lipopolysaccharide transport periplasmic protein LptA [Rhodanobacter sp.]
MTATARSRRASASRRWVAGLLVACSLAMLPALVVAKQSDRQEPMNFAAKHTDAYNAPNTITTLQGSVKITQGTLLLTGDEAKIHLGADSQISQVVVTGKPAHIQQLDDNGNLMTGNAAQLDYDNIHSIAVLTGQAAVKQQGRGEFHGDKLTYNTASSQITGDSGGDGLVHGTFLPKPQPAGAPQPASKPAAAVNAPSVPAPAHSSPPQGQR